MYYGLLEMSHGKKSSILHEKLFLLVIYQRLKRLMTEPMLIFLGLETRLDFKYVKPCLDLVQLQLYARGFDDLILTF